MQYSLYRRFQNGTLGLLRVCWIVLTIPAGAQQAAGDDPLMTEPKLAPKIVVNAEGVSVGELLARIGKATGTKLRADREAADDKAIVFGPARPAHEVLNDLAALFGDVWTKQKDDEGESLVLVRSGRTREREQELRDAPMRAMLAKMEEQVRALSETPAQFNARSPDDPIWQNLNSGRTATALYASLDSRQRETLFTAGQLALPAARRTPQQQTLVRMAKAVHGNVPVQSSGSGAQKETRSNVPMTGTLPRPGQTTAGADPNLRRTIWFTADTYSDHIALALGEAGEAFVFAQLKCVYPAVAGRQNPYTQRLPAVPRMYPYAASPQTVEVDWIAKLRTLAETKGLSVLSDFYRMPAVSILQSVPPVEERKDNTDIIERDTLAAEANRLWWQQGDSLLFRRRNWFVQTQYEVPDRWLLDMIRRLTKQEKKPTYADVLKIAELTPKQMMGLDGRGRLPEAPTYFQGAQECLKLLREKPAAQGRLTDFLPERFQNAPLDTEKLNYLKYADMSGMQRTLLPACLELRRQDVSPETLNTLSFGAALLEPDGDRPVVRVGVQFVFDKAFDALLFTLPTALPDDRRSKTKVERAE